MRMAPISASTGSLTFRMVQGKHLPSTLVFKNIHSEFCLDLTRSPIFLLEGSSIPQRRYSQFCKLWQPSARSKCQLSSKVDVKSCEFFVAGTRRSSTSTQATQVSRCLTQSSLALEWLSAGTNGSQKLHEQWLFREQRWPDTNWGSKIYYWRNGLRQACICLTKVCIWSIWWHDSSYLMHTLRDHLSYWYALPTRGTTTQTVQACKTCCICDNSMSRGHGRVEKFSTMWICRSYSILQQ